MSICTKPRLPFPRLWRFYFPFYSIFYSILFIYSFILILSHLPLPSIYHCLLLYLSGKKITHRCICKAILEAFFRSTLMAKVFKPTQQLLRQSPTQWVTSTLAQWLKSKTWAWYLAILVFRPPSLSPSSSPVDSVLKTTPRVQSLPFLSIANTSISSHHPLPIIAS